MSGGLGLRPGVDASLVTGSIQDDAGKPRDTRRMSDEATIRNAVSSADIDSQGSRPLAWANADTGARGAISGLSEFREDGLICRRFSTTKESFDGVRLFSGRACMVSAGAWRLEKLDAL